ncbi:MAG: minor capsid protein [Clostridium sp.]
MKNSEYWEQRIANKTWQTYNNLEEKNRDLLEMYQDASLQISEELYKVTEKINGGKGITLSDMHKYNRLTGLQKNMENIIRGLGDNVEAFGKNNMMEGFKDTYSNVMAQIGQTQFSMIPKKVMEEMLNRPWLGSSFSERLWKNTQVLASNLNEILVTGLTQGKTIAEIAIQLSNMMNTGFNVSHKLVRTETMHYLNESAKKAYKNGGCEEVQVWAAVDERLCKVCGVKHGNMYRIKDCPTLPLHSNCRCTILPIVDREDAKKDHEAAKKDINNEFNRRNIPEEKTKQKMKDNYETDKKQYKKYKEILGENTPKSFDKFQSLKYNDNKKYEELKSLYKDTKSGKVWLKSTFPTEKKFNTHIKKHLYQYENFTEQDYLNEARKLLAAPFSSEVEGFVSEIGFLFKYRKSTNDFAIGRADGKISTLYKPDDGYDEWLKQIKLFKK